MIGKANCLAMNNVFTRCVAKGKEGVVKPGITFGIIFCSQPALNAVEAHNNGLWI